jgi:hypothetical protein
MDGLMTKQLTRARLEAAAECAADAVMQGRDDLAAPLGVIIDALDASDLDPDLEDAGDLEEQHDAERGCWGSGAGLDQARLTYEIGPDGGLLSYALPADVPGFERVTNSLPLGEIERLKVLARQLEKGVPRQGYSPKRAKRVIDPVPQWAYWGH